MFPLVAGLIRHRRTVFAMGELAASGLRSGHLRDLSESVVRGHVPAYDRALGDAFIEVTQGVHNGLVPPTFYVTWAMRALAQSLVKVCLPYDYSRALHAASEFTYDRPMRIGDRADFEVRVAHVDDNAFRARIRVECVVTGPSYERLLTQTMELHVPKARKPTDGSKRPIDVIASDMLQVSSFHLAAEAGRQYASVSGDFNPVHTSSLAARVLGFKRAFIQGYCSKALIAHRLMRELGGQEHLRSLRVEFKRPILLPADVSLFMKDQAIAFGHAGGEAYVRGVYSAQN